MDRGRRDCQFGAVEVAIVVAHNALRSDQREALETCAPDKRVDITGGKVELSFDIPMHAVSLLMLAR